MPDKALPIYITPIAEKKIIEIAKRSTKKWGRKTTHHYLENLNKVINLVASGLLPTQQNSEFSARFSFCLAEQHYIFFEIFKDKLIITTIFHTAMNIKERIRNEQPGLRQEITEVSIKLEQNKKGAVPE